MNISVGKRLRSQVCTTEAIVVRTARVEITCGGQPMIPHSDTPTGDVALEPRLAGGNQLGKRYTDETGALEIMVTKQGVGTLAAGDTPLTVKEAKVLPSSD